MTQEIANEIFKTNIGIQLDVIYVTSDGQPFIRMEEAIKHSDGLLNVDKSIIQFYPEY